MKRAVRIFCGQFLAISLTASSSQAAEQIGSRPDQQKFREIYKELVETDTSVDSGNCTLLVDKIEKRLRAAGFTDSEIYRFTPGGFPKGAASW